MAGPKALPHLLRFQNVERALSFTDMLNKESCSVSQNSMFISARETCVIDLISCYRRRRTQTAPHICCLECCHPQMGRTWHPPRRITVFQLLLPWRVILCYLDQCRSAPRQTTDLTFDANFCLARPRRQWPVLLSLPTSANADT